MRPYLLATVMILCASSVLLASAREPNTTFLPRESHRIERLAILPGRSNGLMWKRRPATRLCCSTAVTIFPSRPPIAARQASR